MTHGEPRHEYLTEQKEEYREQVWSSFAEAVPDVSTAKVLFFPGRHGLEIPVALRHGFRQENLIACEENAALLATAKWRKEYPFVRCYGTEVTRTIERIRCDGLLLNAANLDFCSNLSRTTFGALESLIDGPIADSFVLALSILKGREDRALVSSVRALMDVGDAAIDRVAVIRLYLANHLRCCTNGLVKGEYRTGTKNMMWAVWLVRQDQWLIEQYAQWIRNHLPDIGRVLDLRRQAGAHYVFGAPGYNIDKTNSLLDQSSRLANDLLHDYDTFRAPLQVWCARDGITNETANFGELCAAVEVFLTSMSLFLQEDEMMAESLKTVTDKLVSAQTERLQLLQAGRAYN